MKGLNHLFSIESHTHELIHNWFHFWANCHGISVSDSSSRWIVSLSWLGRSGRGWISSRKLVKYVIFFFFDFDEKHKFSKIEEFELLRLGGWGWLSSSWLSWFRGWLRSLFKNLFWVTHRKSLKFKLFICPKTENLILRISITQSICSEWLYSLK